VSFFFACYHSPYLLNRQNGTGPMGISMTSSTLQQCFADLIHSAVLRAHRQLVCIDYSLDFIVAAFDACATPLIIGHTEEGLSWRQARQKAGTRVRAYRGRGGRRF
jgi:hypothetical protein